MLQLKDWSCNAAKTSLLGCSSATLLSTAVTDHLILLTKAVIDISMHLNNSICKIWAILTTFAACPRYNHIGPVGSHCVWLYSVKPQLAISTHFPVTKPVVISRCDCNTFGKGFGAKRSQTRQTHYINAFAKLYPHQQIAHTLLLSSFTKSAFSESILAYCALHPLSFAKPHTAVSLYLIEPIDLPSSTSEYGIHSEASDKVWTRKISAREKDMLLT